MTDLTFRPPRDEDIPRLLELADEWAQGAGIDAVTTAEDVHHEWSAPGFGEDILARVVECDGAIAATAECEFEHGQAWGGGYVAKEFRARGIGAAILRWALNTARARSDISEMHTGTSASYPDAIELIESFGGFSYERTFFRMLNTSPGHAAEPEWPDGVRLTSLRDDALIDAVVRARNDSFIDHWNFVPWKAEDVVHRLAQPGEDPSVWFIAAAGDEIAGLCLCRIDARGGVARAQLGPIGTTRAFRGIGLGRALLRHALRELAARGAAEVTLGVDSVNPSGAVGLYERNGFVTTQQFRVYRMAL